MLCQRRACSWYRLDSLFHPCSDAPTQSYPVHHHSRNRVSFNLVCVICLIRKKGEKSNLLKIYEEKLAPLGHGDFDSIGFGALTTGYIKAERRNRQKSRNFQLTCKRCYFQHFDSVAPRPACHDVRLAFLL